MYRYVLDPHKLEDRERIRFLGRVDNVDKVSGVFVLDNGIIKISCIPKDLESVRNLKIGDVVRVFGRIVKISNEAEISVFVIQKPNVNLRIYNNILSKIL